MSRDFTPDLNDFREPSPGPRESARPAPAVRSSTERTRVETSRPEARSVHVREPRPKDVPSRDLRAVLYDRYRRFAQYELALAVRRSRQVWSPRRTRDLI